MDARVHFSARSSKLLTVRALGLPQCVIALYPQLQFSFPSGLNLSKGILCVSGLPLITKDSLAVRERERPKQLNSCSETVLMLTPLYLRQNNQCKTTAFPLPLTRSRSLRCFRGLVCHAQQNRKQHLSGKQAG